MCWYCSYTDKRTENRVSRGCQKTESRQGKTAGEKGNGWTLSCHAEEFICVFYLVECGVVAQRLQLRLWPPLHLPGGSGRHWFCFDCEMVREIGDGLQMMILSSQDYCGTSQWWEPACPWMGQGRYRGFCFWSQRALGTAGCFDWSETCHGQCSQFVLSEDTTEECCPDEMC